MAGLGVVLLCLAGTRLRASVTWHGHIFGPPVGVGGREAPLLCGGEKPPCFLVVLLQIPARRPCLTK